MKAPSVGTVIKKKSFNYDPRKQENRWDFWCLTNRRKIKKRNGMDFEYQVIEYKWDGWEYKVEDKTISFHTIRSLFQNKTPHSVVKLNQSEFDAYMAKQLLLGG